MQVKNAREIHSLINGTFSINRLHHAFKKCAAVQKKLKLMRKLKMLKCWECTQWEISPWQAILQSRKVWIFWDDNIASWHKNFVRQTITRQIRQRSWHVFPRQMFHLITTKVCQNFS